VRCGGTRGAGLSSAPSVGWETFGAWSSATIARSESMVPSFISPASSSSCGGLCNSLEIFEKDVTTTHGIRIQVIFLIGLY
jgi:hypothetical protein